MSGIVYLIGAGPGDPGLLTIKGRDCLGRADVVVYDRLVSKEILALIPSSCKRVYVGKAADNHTVAQEEISALLVERARRGETVARLKGGDPFVYGRGAEEAEALVEAGIRFEVVPGVSSALAAPSYAGIPLTHRALSSGFHVVAGHECLDSPGTSWAELGRSGHTLVILMAMGHLREIADRLIAHGRASDTPAAIVRWGTTPEQEVAVATLATIAGIAVERKLAPPAVIVVGEVVTLHHTLNWFEPAAHLSR